MAENCGDVLRLSDLQTAKKHNIFEAEVITGKTGGTASGSDIDFATNPVTGQVQKTLPAVLRDAGYRPTEFDFTTGGTISAGDRSAAVLWPLASGGDGDYYYWEGELPKTIPANSTPESTGGVKDGAWRPVGDITLRQQLTTTGEGKGADFIPLVDGGTVQDSISTLTPEMFGAVGDGVTDDRHAIQAAINAAGAVFSRTGARCKVELGYKTYAVAQNPDSPAISGEVSAGMACLCMRSGVVLTGAGCLKLKAGATGTNAGAIITNWIGPCYDAEINGITIDGNAGNVSSTRMTAINIVDSVRTRIINVTVQNNKVGTAGGIYLRRSNTSSSEYGCVESIVRGCYVFDVGYIGIQCERPDGVIITGNSVARTGDNAIDIEGNNPGAQAGISRQMIISGNVCRGNKNGVFIESCSGATISGNDITDVTGIGIVVNRINTGSFNNIISANHIRGLSTESGYGIRVINNSGGGNIEGNHITNFRSAIMLNGNATRLFIGANYHAGIGHFIVELAVSSGATVAALRCYVAKQFIQGGQTNGLPALLSPIGCPSNYPNRFSASTYEPAHYSDLNGPGEVNYTTRTFTLAENAAWPKKYSIYNVNGDGYTEVMTGSADPGSYVVINGQTYLVDAGHAASQRRVKKWNGSGYVDGDWTEFLLEAFPAEVKRIEWTTL